MLNIIISGIIMVLLDGIYLTLIKNYFSKQIEQVQNSPMKIKLFGAVITYIILIFGINYFIINQNKNIFDAFLLGIVIYGVYEWTNYSLITNWSLLTVGIDTLWGGILFAITTFLLKKII